MWLRTPDGVLVNLDSMAGFSLATAQFGTDAPQYEVRGHTAAADSVAVFKGTEEQCRNVLALIARAVSLHPLLDLTKGVTPL